jgi:rod shape-determining protein MreC
MEPRRRILVLLAVLCLGHVLLISAQVPSQAGDSVLHAAAFGSLARVQGGIASVADGVGGFWSRYLAASGAVRENDVLRQRLLELEGQLQGERARSARVDGLEDALALQQSVVAPTLAARVIAGNPVPGVLTITIDRGTADGLRPNMAVINGQGVVGRVVGRPSAGAASVQLLIDRSASAGAFLEAAATAGSVTSGHADGLLRLELVPATTPIAVGDRVVTSGQDGFFPPGFLIGHVTEVAGTGRMREIVVTPAVNFTHLQVVLVILATPGETGGGRP